MYCNRNTCVAGKSIDLSSPDERGGHSLVAINSTILITFGGHYCRWEPGGPHRPFRDYETALLDDPKVMRTRHDYVESQRW